LKYLIVGLGNIGAEYAHTRHNIGFDVVDALVLKHNGTFRSDRYADVAEIKVKGRTLVCIKPTTYMNLSGNAVRYWLEKEKIPIENMLVIVDELALPLSRLRMRSSGSSGGHNGLKHIEEVLQTGQYSRLRFGIGNDYPKGKQVDFVLGKWTSEEQPLVQKKIKFAAEAIETFVFQGVSRAMNQVNITEISL
jgi:PTH1 family peptidyl-tRNA hydrolase